MVLVQVLAKTWLKPGDMEERDVDPAPRPDLPDLPDTSAQMGPKGPSKIRGGSLGPRCGVRYREVAKRVPALCLHSARTCHIFEIPFRMQLLDETHCLRTKGPASRQRGEESFNCQGKPGVKRVNMLHPLRSENCNICSLPRLPLGPTLRRAASTKTTELRTTPAVTP